MRRVTCSVILLNVVLPHAVFAQPSTSVLLPARSANGSPQVSTETSVIAPAQISVGNSVTRPSSPHSAKPDPSSSSSSSSTMLALQVGQTQVLRVPGVKRVVVGNGEVIQVVVLEGREVVIFARSHGQSSLHVWRTDGTRDDYDIAVDAEGTRQMQHELQALLKGIPRARSVVVGDKIVIEGHDLSDGDRARVAALSQRYPQVVDFTSAVGWDSMVMLDVKVVEIPRHHLKALGIRWSTTSQGGINAGLSWDAVGGAALSDRAGESPLPRGSANAPFAGYLGANMLWTSRIDALSESGEAVILAQPQLLARSGATADFLAGGEVPYATVDSNGKSNTVFKPYGISIEMTPQVERNGIVRSRIVVEASAVDSSVTGTGGPALKTRRASTEFNVRSGRTLVLAGFLSHERSVSHSGIPGLRELPLIGGLFGTRQTIERDTELAIFVTPTIVSEDHPALQERAVRAEQIVSTSRSEDPWLNVPIRHSDFSENLFDDADADADADAHIHGNDHDTCGSQWDTCEEGGAYDRG